MDGLDRERYHLWKMIDRSIKRKAWSLLQFVFFLDHIRYLSSILGWLFRRVRHLNIYVCAQPEKSFSVLNNIALLVILTTFAPERALHTNETNERCQYQRPSPSTTHRGNKQPNKQLHHRTSWDLLLLLLFLLLAIAGCAVIVLRNFVCQNNAKRVAFPGCFSWWGLVFWFALYWSHLQPRSGRWWWWQV